ncbi:PREDICTED: uncharacterized protein LOC105584084 isoform X2 [Cercocebus atys]|uniref:uncharacterized protein LOC105584084 isoform X2 n=1 Tax=Cercocebus atys TaxID=9531 RepID=UPI0005F55CD7|nr:PREDICTED: uncharacterized protein LOC105584084 isoform X2 [Cercocebus atys]
MRAPSKSSTQKTSVTRCEKCFSPPPSKQSSLQWTPNEWPPIQLQHYLPGGSIRSHKLRALSPRLAPTTARHQLIIKDITDEETYRVKYGKRSTDPPCPPWTHCPPGISRNIKGFSFNRHSENLGELQKALSTDHGSFSFPELRLGTSLSKRCCPLAISRPGGRDWNSGESFLFCLKVRQHDFQISY